MLALASLACQPPDPPRSLRGPEASWPVARAPYVREIRWTLDRPVTVTGTATDGQHPRSFEVRGDGEVVVPLIGLYADATWTVELTATDDAGEVLRAEPLTFTTDPLPELFPSAEMRVLELEQMQPGYTLMSVASTGVAAYVVVVDEAGEVAWLFDGEVMQSFEALPTESGVRMLFGASLVEMDWMGRITRRLESVGPPIEAPGEWVPGAIGFNHDFHLSDRGTWLVIGKQVGNRAAFPASYDDPTAVAPATLFSDVVLEIDPEAVEVVREWSLFDHLDPDRIAYGSLDHGALGLDWTHVNGVSERGDEWLVSARHQDAVFLVDARTGGIDFILGNPDNWSAPWSDLLLEPVGQPFAWPYHQHGAKWLTGDRVLMFDNGNFQASPFTTQVQVPNSDIGSRVVQYQVDRAARTVRQEWSFELEPTVFSGAMGDADPLPNGHVLGTFAYVLVEGGVQNSGLDRAGPSGQVVEFDPTTGEVVWHLDLWAPAGEGPTAGWHVFRAERFTSFGD
ncbi:MAG: aryl-sulfate sulfotransferase [Myxococcota bacterium]